jgi:hypothetical protein
MPTSTERFRRQHAELGDLATALVALLTHEWGGIRADEAQRTLSQLAGKLRVHAAMENEALYPRLLTHDDDRVREVARGFVDEFGAAYRKFLEFRARWVTAETIAQAPDAFALEARAAIAILGERIAHENAELYRMVDTLYRTPD